MTSQFVHVYTSRDSFLPTFTRAAVLLRLFFFFFFVYVWSQMEVRVKNTQQTDQPRRFVQPYQHEALSKTRQKSTPYMQQQDAGEYQRFAVYQSHPVLLVLRTSYVRRQRRLLIVSTIRAASAAQVLLRSMITYQHINND